MRPVDYVVLERTVIQKTPEMYKAESPYVEAQKLEALMTNTGVTWKEVKNVYILKERRKATTGKQKEFNMVGLYLECKKGCMDYQYVQGLDILVVVASIYEEITLFMQGGWN